MKHTNTAHAVERRIGRGSNAPKATRVDDCGAYGYSTSRALARRILIRLLFSNIYDEYARATRAVTRLER